MNDAITIDSLIENLKKIDMSHGKTIYIPLSPSSVVRLIEDHKERTVEKLDDIQRIVQMIKDSQNMPSKPFYTALCDIYENLTGSKYCWWCHK